MKLLRYGLLGSEKPGLLDAEGYLRDLSHLIADFSPIHLENLDLWHLLSSLDLSLLPKVSEPVRIGACIGRPGKVICVGYNSKLHNTQMGVVTTAGTDMVVFLKPSSSVCGPQDPILYTRHMKKLDWEAELGIVIGKKGKYISRTSAKEHILGYTCVNDISDRYLQLETFDKQFTKGKGFDNAAPIGPYIVTKDEIPDASNLHISLWVNGVLRQDFNSKDYIHNDEDVVSYLSQYFTLYPGDIISMGSAPGNAKSWGEDMFLKPHDKVSLEISGLGQQEQIVVLE
ncbi:MAG: fumarylacetoacetate hydrolase family protein [Legionellales bacterium]|nr:fumarylacetoacetate hydrolase family protein [Legionellales bacterium]